ncbi:MAG: serine/threonine-protein kinase, partial [Verrucomicrobiota bacterium]
MSTDSNICSRCGGELQDGRCLVCFWRTGLEVLQEPATAFPQDLDFQIGDYRILAEIGRGGMGVVYRAQQKSLQRHVALKTIRSVNLTDSRQAERFRLEAVAAASLDHPNIVPVYDCGESEGESYYTMRLIEKARSLDRLGEGANDFKSIARIMAQVAEAIDHAHQHGILHRDLKPSNILLSPDDIPYVADFGLARILAAGEEADVTLSGNAIGSPAYMSPEQASGSSEVTTRTDLYGIGAILYRLLTGQPPNKGSNTLATLNEAKKGHIRPPQEINPEVPKDLGIICLKALHSNPEQRYRSAGALAKDLNRFFNNEPIKARPATWLEKGFLLTRRHPVSASLAGMTLVSIMIAIIGIAWQWKRADHNASELSLALKQLQFEQAVHSRERSDLTDSLARFAAVLRIHPEDQPARQAVIDILTESRLPLDFQPPLTMPGGIADWHIAGDYCLTRNQAGQVIVWDLIQWNKAYTLEGIEKAFLHGNADAQPCFSYPSQDRLVWNVRDLKSGHLIATPALGNSPTELAFIAPRRAGSWPALLISEASIATFNLDQPGPARILSSWHSGTPSMVKPSPAGDQVAVVHDDTVEVFNLYTGRKVRANIGPGATINEIAWADESNALAAYSRKNGNVWFGLTDQASGDAGHVQKLGQAERLLINGHSRLFFAITDQPEQAVAYYLDSGARYTNAHSLPGNNRVSEFLWPEPSRTRHNPDFFLGLDREKSGFVRYETNQFLEQATFSNPKAIESSSVGLPVLATAGSHGFKAAIYCDDGSLVVHLPDYYRVFLPPSKKVQSLSFSPEEERLILEAEENDQRTLEVLQARTLSQLLNPKPIHPHAEVHLSPQGYAVYLVEPVEHGTGKQISRMGLLTRPGLENAIAGSLHALRSNDLAHLAEAFAGQWFKPGGNRSSLTHSSILERSDGLPQLRPFLEDPAALQEPPLLDDTAEQTPPRIRQHLIRYPNSEAAKKKLNHDLLTRSRKSIDIYYAAQLDRSLWSRFPTPESTAAARKALLNHTFGPAWPPPTPPGLDPRILDLGPYYNTRIERMSGNGPFQNRFFSLVSASPVRLQELDWDIRGAITLAHPIKFRSPDYFARWPAIPLDGKRCRRIHFLHALTMASPAPPARFPAEMGHNVGTYRFQYV